MGRYISPEPGTVWRLIDDYHLYPNLTGRLGVVKSSETNPDYNGDGEVEILYTNGTTLHMKVRRFVLRHKYIKTLGGQ